MMMIIFYYYDYFDDDDDYRLLFGCIFSVSKREARVGPREGGEVTLGVSCKNIGRYRENYHP